MNIYSTLISNYSLSSNTRVENNKYIRTWRQSHSGNKELTREFYIKFTVNAILNGRYGKATFDTIEQAAARAAEWQSAVSAKYGIRDLDWCTECHSTPTHVSTAYKGSNGKSVAEVYITETAGGVIRETIAEAKGRDLYADMVKQRESIKGLEFVKHCTLVGGVEHGDTDLVFVFKRDAKDAWLKGLVEVRENTYEAYEYLTNAYDRNDYYIVTGTVVTCDRRGETKHDEIWLNFS